MNIARVPPLVIMGQNESAFHIFIFIQMNTYCVLGPPREISNLYKGVQQNMFTTAT